MSFLTLPDPAQITPTKSLPWKAASGKGGGGFSRGVRWYNRWKSRVSP
ncbi:hypothetical protein RHECNPAF_750094 [Rhizobium etli CNPAF512]|nr:hypothetical protein RHECNPAF_750094 [Rhizobium etli CNPAF512]